MMQSLALNVLMFFAGVGAHATWTKLRAKVAHGCR